MQPFMRRLVFSFEVFCPLCVHLHSSAPVLFWKIHLPHAINGSDDVDSVSGLMFRHPLAAYPRKKIRLPGADNRIGCVCEEKTDCKSRVDGADLYLKSRQKDASL